MNKINKAVKLSLLALSVGLFTVPELAVADTTTGSLGFSNVGVSVGNISTSLPAGKVSLGHSFGDYVAGFSGTFGSGNGLSYQNEKLGAGKLMTLAGGYLIPEVDVGYTRLGVSYGSVSTMYSGIGAEYAYPVSNRVTLTANTQFGRDFSASVVSPAGISGQGGLYYTGGAGVDVNGIGSGLLSVGYEYRHMPVAQSLSLDTSNFKAEYSIPF